MHSSCLPESPRSLSANRERGAQVVTSVWESVLCLRSAGDAVGARGRGILAPSEGCRGGAGPDDPRAPCQLENCRLPWIWFFPSWEDPDA